MNSHQSVGYIGSQLAYLFLHSTKPTRELSIALKSNDCGLNAASEEGQK